MAISINLFLQTMSRGMFLVPILAGFKSRCSRRDTPRTYRASVFLGSKVSARVAAWAASSYLFVQSIHQIRFGAIGHNINKGPPFQFTVCSGKTDKVGGLRATQLNCQEILSIRGFIIPRVEENVSL